MSFADVIITPDINGDQQVLAVAVGASTAEVIIGPRKKFALTVTGSFHLKRGKTGMAAAAATDHLMGAGEHVMATSNSWDAIRVFNPTTAATTISVYVMPIENA